MTQTCGLSIYLPLEHLEGPPPQSHTLTVFLVQPPHYCFILDGLNHSLMGGRTDRYCYSLWGLAVLTNRRLWRSRCQRGHSGYRPAYNGLE